MPSALSDPAFSNAKSIATFARLSGIAMGTLVPAPLTAAAVKRLITVDEDENVTPNEDSEDPLAELLVEAAERLQEVLKAEGGGLDL